MRKSIPGIFQWELAIKRMDELSTELPMEPAWKLISETRKLREVSRPTIRRRINSHMVPKIVRIVVSEKFNITHNWLSTCSAQSPKRINCSTLKCVIGTRFRELSPKLRIGSAFANCRRNLRFPAKCFQKARFRKLLPRERHYAERVDGGRNFEESPRKYGLET